MHNMNLNDVRSAQRDGTLATQSIDTLKSMREVCVKHIQDADKSAIPIKQSVDEEIRRKETSEMEVKAEQRHQVLLAEQRRLRASVDRLAKPHWVLWATLIAGAIAAVAGVILLFR
jgi:hypothetical protein